MIGKHNFKVMLIILSFAGAGVFYFLFANVLGTIAFVLAGLIIDAFFLEYNWKKKEKVKE